MARSASRHRCAAYSGSSRRMAAYRVRVSSCSPAAWRALQVPVPRQLEDLPIELGEPFGEHSGDDHDEPVGGDAIGGDQPLELRLGQELELALAEGHDRRGRGTIGDEAYLSQECRRVHLGQGLTLPIGPVLEDLDAALQT